MRRRPFLSKIRESYFVDFNTLDDQIQGSPAINFFCNMFLFLLV